MCLKATPAGLEHDFHYLNHRPLPIDLEKKLYGSVTVILRASSALYGSALQANVLQSPSLLFATLNISAFFNACFFLSITEHSRSSSSLMEHTAIFIFFFKDMFNVVIFPMGTVWITHGEENMFLWSSCWWA